MGGKNETYLNGPDSLRMHESSGDVHIHSRKGSLKFQMKIKKFKAEYDSLKKDIISTNFSGEIEDHKGVLLVATRNGNDIEWSLDANQPQLVGFNELDDFLTNY